MQDIIKLPKIELHCHLDGSLSLGCVEALLNRKVQEDELTVREDCRDLAQYLQKFQIPLQCLQTREGLKRATEDFLESVAKENMRYIEVRFAPMSSVHDHLPVREVIEAVLDGLKVGKEKNQVEAQVIVCAMRHHSEEINRQMLRVASEYQKDGICAADLAGNEAAFPMKQFVPLFQYVKELGMPCTIHAGECGDVKNIEEAIRCGARRIGHGIAMAGNQAIQHLCREQKIGIEMCPTSNLQTKAVTNGKAYPLREFLDRQLLVSINTDNRTVSDTTITKELEFIQRNNGITDEELEKLYRNAVETSFAEDSIKNQLLKEYSKNRLV